MIVGGVGQAPQVKALSAGVDILVATPGRLLDLVEQGHLKLDATTNLVLDEADRMLDMGFIRDIRRIVAALPRNRHSMLFSATMPADVEQLARSILHQPVRIDIMPEKRTAENIDQRVFHVPAAEKRALLASLLKDASYERVLVFTRTKHTANRVAEHLGKGGFVAEAIHGNKSQSARQRALERFRSGAARILVATDIAARGIDIDNITHVINFELPNEPESYVHRIGRTARAGAAGARDLVLRPGRERPSAPDRKADQDRPSGSCRELRLRTGYRLFQSAVGPRSRDRPTPSAGKRFRYKSKESAA